MVLVFLDVRRGGVGVGFCGVCRDLWCGDGSGFGPGVLKRPCGAAQWRGPR